MPSPAYLMPRLANTERACAADRHCRGTTLDPAAPEIRFGAALPAQRQRRTKLYQPYEVLTFARDLR